ncbi:DUF427 domain-containing protein [Rhodovulum sp. DZ06]|uniref:DUF427 domain-containing protein n=1 Tax=Rhodovulum sp. DZ06 TaxID=3425126 RepID=UPI003D32B4FF
MTESFTVMNPENRAHYMRVRPAGKRVEIRLGDVLLARSEDALRVLECGRDLYDPVLYLPAADIAAPLAPAEKRTRCPIKGAARYRDLADGSAPEIAWVYEDPVPGAERLAGRIAFDAARVTIIESPL